MKITDFGVAVVAQDSHLSKWVQEQRTLAVAEGFCRLFTQYIPKGGVVVDVGASLGDHTITYSDMVGPLGSVFAFEPNPVAFECLAYNMRSRQNVSLWPVGLGSVAERCEVVPDENLGAAQLRQNPSGDVVVTTLDAALGWLPRLDWLKIDAEGFEPDIIAGAVATLRRCRPALLVEINRPILAARGKSPDDILRPLVDLGYRVQPCEPGLTMDMEMVDVLCLPS